MNRQTDSETDAFDESFNHDTPLVCAICGRTTEHGRFLLPDGRTLCSVRCELTASVMHGSEYRIQELEKRIAELESQLATAVEFVVGDPSDYSAVYIRKCFNSGPNGDLIMWRVSHSATVLNRSGEWEYEPLPSSRDDDFYQRCRFDTYDAAKEAATTAHEAIKARFGVADK